MNTFSANILCHRAALSYSSEPAIESVRPSTPPCHNVSPVDGSVQGPFCHLTRNTCIFFELSAPFLLYVRVDRQREIQTYWAATAALDVSISDIRTDDYLWTFLLELAFEFILACERVQLWGAFFFCCLPLIRRRKRRLGSKCV